MIYFIFLLSSGVNMISFCCCSSERLLHCHLSLVCAEELFCFSYTFHLCAYNYICLLMMKLIKL